MSKLFGRANIDWKILHRSVRRESTSAVEHFVLNTKNGRREIFFDGSSFIDKNLSSADAIGPAENDPMFQRVVEIRFLPKAAFDLSGFIHQTSSSEKLREFLSDDDLMNIRRGFDERKRPKGKDEIIVRLPQMTAIKLGVLLDLIRNDTNDLEVQDWIDNCTGAIRYALSAE
ncbi:MAG: hypothetical protein ACK5WW_08110 [Brevundimonas sp.]|jgi:hypothetical protein|uniref:hypothetical protein n=1 Tax=Brevundimonas sp. TaxID=1871086 RepID=UPI0022C38F73|nr:hypothetical protein [Brevundimonas sp.]